MPQPKLKKNSGLGRTIIKDRFKGHKPKDGDTALHTTDLNDGPSWTNLQSITHQKDLDEFLSTAQLAGTQFTAERLNIKVVTNHYENPFLLSSEKEKETLARHEANKERLVIPRRPKWDKSTTPEQLEHEEKESFLRWRQQDEFLLTPFERNIEVWRQLWRVIERSDLVVQIVDARNPLFFRSIDLEKYVKEIDEKKKNLLLINKADLLTILANEEIEKQIKTDVNNDGRIFLNISSILKPLEIDSSHYLYKSLIGPFKSIGKYEYEIIHQPNGNCANNINYKPIIIASSTFTLFPNLSLPSSPTSSSLSNMSLPSMSS
ncbi:5281_t:CDS:2, partial [Entrophospora sp. SA101]